MGTGKHGHDVAVGNHRPLGWTGGAAGIDYDGRIIGINLFLPLVNGLLVGLIESDQHYQRYLNSGSNDSLEEYYEKMGSQVPMGRYGTAEEFANMACFLASDAGSYITGTAINVDGNRCPTV